MYAQALIPALFILALQNPGARPTEDKPAPTPVPTPAPAEQDTPSTTETDGTSTAVSEAEAAAERDRYEAECFTTCDYNGDGWIAYREGQCSLLMTRASFAQYDNDSDGRITRDEFGQRYRELLDRTGAFRRPTPEGVTITQPTQPDAPLGSPENPVDLAALIAGAAAATPATPETFVGKYDVNIDGRLSADELVTASKALGFEGMPAASIMTTLDLDKSGFVEPPELKSALNALGLLTAAGAAPPLPKAKSIEELFGESKSRESYAGSTPRPPYIKGPVRPFRRLDVNDDGFVQLEDLEMLAISAHPRIRPAAVIASLDLNADGQLSKEELAAALDG